MWYNLAASSGDQVGIQNRSLIEKKMLPQQLALAQELARVCKESNFINCGEAQSIGSSNDKITKKNENSNETFTGTAFFINSYGNLLTNNHVINECSKINIKTADSSLISARVSIASKDDDLAILKVDFSPKDYAEFRVEKTPRQGETVITYGFPLTGLLSSTGNVTSGIITSLTGLGDNTRQIQISTAVQPGNSGGPLIDETGLVVGVVVAKLNALAISKITSDIPQNVNFAIRASNATSLLEAKGISFSAAKQGKRQEITELSDKLKKYTVLVECKR
jgi:S1-C subfamily serine protease